MLNATQLYALATVAERDGVMEYKALAYRLETSVAHARSIFEEIAIHPERPNDVVFGSAHIILKTRATCDVRA